MKKWKFILPMIIGLILLLSWRMLLGIMFGGYTPPPVAINAAVATAKIWPKEIPSLGTLEAIHSVTIAPEMEGRIAQIFFKSGQMVEEGQPLLQLNDEVEQADLKKYIAQYKLAQVTVNRSNQLAPKKVESQAEHERKIADLEEKLSMKQHAEAVIAKKNIKAPLKGQLGIKRVNVGQYVQPGAPLITLTDLSQMHLNLTCPEHQRSLLHVGQKVRIFVDAYRDQEFIGEITSIDPQITPDTRQIHIQATLDNTDGLLYPGMFANTFIVISSTQQVISVPETAIDYSLYGSSIFIIEKKGDPKKPTLTVMRRYVEPGERRDGQVDVVKGLAVDEQVVISGQLKLKDHTTVVIVPDQQSLAIPDSLTKE